MANTFNSDNGFKTVAGTAGSFSSDKNNFCIGTADFAPVFDFSGKDFCKGFKRKIGNRIFGVYNNCDSVKSENGFGKALCFFFIFKIAAGKTDVTGAISKSLYSRSGTGGILGK